MNHYSQDGSMRGKRLPAALSDGYFLPFERTFTESVTLLRDLAKNIRINTDAESGHSTCPSERVQRLIDENKQSLESAQEISPPAQSKRLKDLIDCICTLTEDVETNTRHDLLSA